MHYVSLCAIYKSETRWIDEWIRYYLNMGIDHFYLYCNDDDPGPSAEVLRPYKESGHVDLFYHPGRLSQGDAYKDFMARYRNETRWVGCLDLDEFVLPRHTDSIPELLQDYEDVPALAISWTIFGSGGLIDYPPNQINHFLSRGPDQCGPNRHTKTFAQTRYGHAVGYHLAVNEHRNPTIPDPKQPHQRDFTADIVRIVHYVVRNKRYFDEVKSKRGRATRLPNDRNETFWKWHDRNEVHDDEISRRFGHLFRDGE